MTTQHELTRNQEEHVRLYDSERIFYFNTHRPPELVKRLQTRYEGFDPSIIAGLAQECLGSDFSLVGDISSDGNFGTGHLIFYVPTMRGEVVVRANRFLDEEPEHYMASESRFTELYRSVGIPTDEVLFADISRTRAPFDFQILSKLPGRDLETDWAGDESQYREISKQLGRYAARQEKLNLHGWGRFKRGAADLTGYYENPEEYLMAYVDYDLGVMAQQGLITERIMNEILAYLNDAKDMLKGLKPKLVHHDLADHNIRYQDGQIVAIFDWENAVAYDPVSELGSAHTWVCHHDRRADMREGFLEEIGDMPQNFDERISLHFLRTMLWKSAFALKGDRFSDRHKGLLNQALSETVRLTI